MDLTDTDPKIQRLLDARSLEMTPAQKAEVLRGAWRAAMLLQLAGLRDLYPGESEARLQERIIERRLGAELYQRVQSSLFPTGR